MRVTCDQCQLNFCLKHRHPLDHDCKPDGKPLSKSGWVQPHPAGPSEGKQMGPFDLIYFLPLRHAAVMRASASSSTASSTSSTGNPRPVSNGVSRAHSSRLDRVHSHTSDIKQAHQIEFSLQRPPAAPHFSVSTECCPSISIFPGWHGKNSPAGIKMSQNQNTDLLCVLRPCRRRIRPYRERWRCRWLIPNQCSLHSGEQIADCHDGVHARAGAVVRIHIRVPSSM